MCGMLDSIGSICTLYALCVVLFFAVVVTKCSLFVVLAWCWISFVLVSVERSHHIEKILPTGRKPCQVCMLIRHFAPAKKEHTTMYL